MQNEEGPLTMAGRAARFLWNLIARARQPGVRPTMMQKQSDTSTAPDDSPTALINLSFLPMATSKIRSAVLVVVLVGVCAMPANCRSVERLYYGFSEDFLVSLGTGAESFLIRKLHNPEEGVYLTGIVQKLCKRGTTGGKNPRIAAELRAFVESAIARDEVRTERIYGAAEALACLGHIGSNDDIDYLITWALDGSKTRAIRWRGERGARDRLIDLFLTNALTGLGVSGHPRARDALLKGRGDPPPTPFVDHYVRETCQALELHRIARNRNTADAGKGADSRRAALSNLRFRRYPGLSESFIVNLGTSAVSFLASRLQSPSDGGDRDMYHRSGIIGRLVHLTAIPSKERGVAIHAISTFVEANTPEYGEISNAHSAALVEAMMALGARGTDAEIPFLVEWATGKPASKYKGNGQRSLHDAERAAVHGLGFLGSAKSLSELKRLRKDPQFIHAAVLAEAIANHAQVRKRGIDALLPE